MNFPLVSSFFPVRVGRLAIAVAIVFLLGACAATKPVKQRDYTAFKESRPRSILVMPPINRSPEIKAPLTFLATATIPLAEAGYYVIPVTLSEETFKQNGVTVAEEAHAIGLGKLREIFGADAVLYITVTRFGTSYRLIDSVVEAGAVAKLVDLRSGLVLWSGYGSVSMGNNQNNHIIAALVVAVVTQVINTLSERAHEAGRAASYQMLASGKRNGILFGPYHPRFGTD